MKRMVSENLIAILKEMDSKGISIGELADMLEAFADDEIQPTLTAGDNIQISEENVISATDTKYTAGTGITINEDNEISADAGEIWESVVNIELASDVGVNVRLFTKEQITDSNVRDIIITELQGNLKELPIWADDIVITLGSVTGIPMIISVSGANFLIQFLKSDFTRVGQYSTKTINNSTLFIYYSHKIN